MSTTVKPETDLDVFARVEEGKIVEYPVYRLHIRNRSHPVAWYTPVVDAIKPELPPFSFYKQLLTVKDGFVEATYTTEAFNLAQLLSQLRRGMGLTPLADPEEIKITDVDPAFIQQVYVLGGQYITELLNAFARTRMYDGIQSLTDYRDSSFTKFQVEGMRGFVLRDRMWEAMLTYFTSVTTGQLPVPTSISDVDAILPVLTWEDAVPDTSTPDGAVVTETTEAPAPVDTVTEVIPEVVPTEGNSEVVEGAQVGTIPGPGFSPIPEPPPAPTEEQQQVPEDPFHQTQPETPTPPSEEPNPGDTEIPTTDPEAPVDPVSNPEPIPEEETPVDPVTDPEPVPEEPLVP